MNFSRTNIIHKFTLLFAFFNASNLCVSEILSSTHLAANLRTRGILKNNSIQNIFLSFFFEKEGFFCVAVSEVSLAVSNRFVDADCEN